jgi:hypothetical protein
VRERAAALRASSTPSGDVYDLREHRPTVVRQRGTDAASAALWRDPKRMGQFTRQGMQGFARGFDTAVRILGSGGSEADVARWWLASPAGIGQTMEDALSYARAAVSRWHGVEQAFFLADDALQAIAPTTFRGLGGLPDEVLDRFLGDAEFDFGGRHSSTSWSPEIGDQFARDRAAEKKEGHCVLLQLTRRSKGVPIQTVGAYGGEREIVLHGHTRWRITGRRRMDDYDTGREYWLIEAEEIIDD